MGADGEMVRASPLQPRGLVVEDVAVLLAPTQVRGGGLVEHHEAVIGPM